MALQSSHSPTGNHRTSVRRTSHPAKSRDENESPNEEPPYDIPEAWVNLDELAATSPVENPEENAIYRHHDLEETRSREQEWNRQNQSHGESSIPTATGLDIQNNGEKVEGTKVSQLATQIYTLSYLIFFSFLGTLARIGLTALTFYPNTPVLFTTIWANFGGSLIMGFLAEDRMLFRHEWGTPPYDEQLTRARRSEMDEESGSSSSMTVIDLSAAKKAHLSTKKTIPLYIGLTTGFCGSFTSFSTFIRDVLLALSNNEFELPTTERSGGYSFLAMLAVIITTVCLTLSALHIGAHLAIGTEKCIPSLPFRLLRKLLDRIVVILALGSWVGVIVLSIMLPDISWRGKAFALVFSPAGCLARFYVSLYLNGRLSSFPLGTFLANVFGTAVLGMTWDIAHSASVGIVGCQVLQGIEDGFCGCLTTISTWVAELNSLRRFHAYIYGTASVVVSLAIMVAIMGGLRWTDGFTSPVCS
ncbi:CrcB-like domain-containing protein [Trichoderma chlorosporum]